MKEKVITLKVTIGEKDAADVYGKLSELLIDWKDRFPATFVSGSMKVRAVK